MTTPYPRPDGCAENDWSATSEITMRPSAAALFLLAPVITSCLVADTDPDLLTTAATVRFVEVEGGCWRLDASNGVRYEPVGLPAAFREDGQQVRVTLRFLHDIGSFCMVGRLAEVVAIRNR